MSRTFETTRSSWASLTNPPSSLSSSNSSPAVDSPKPGVPPPNFVVPIFAVNSELSEAQMDILRQSSTTAHEQQLRLAANSSPKGSTTNHDSSQPWSAKSSPDLPSADQNPGSSGKHGRRRGHTKSRRGCFNCKRRRIKCPENRPSCSHCIKQGLNCEYPAVQIQQATIASRQPAKAAAAASAAATAATSIPMQIQSTGPVFNMTDFRLFHYFVETAYPHQPPANDNVWQHEVPSIAHRHDFLLHSMLGLSASELASREPESAHLAVTAMSHRVRAITSFNQALSRGVTDMEEGNAMLATCYALLFQSVLMDDGIVEYMAFIRGCVLVTTQLGRRNQKIIFHQLLGEEARAAMKPHLGSGPPPIDLDDISNCIASLEAMAHLCKRQSEKAWHLMLQGLAKCLFISSEQAQILLQKVYGAFSYYMSNDDFQQVIDPKNVVGQILQSHLVVLQLVMQPITKYDRMSKRDSGTGFGTVRWLESVHRNIPPEMWGYVRWPTSIYARTMKKNNMKTNLCNLHAFETEQQHNAEQAGLDLFEPLESLDSLDGLDPLESLDSLVGVDEQ